NSGLFEASGVGSPDQAPDPRRELATGYDGWTAAGVDSMVIVPRASTHLEYTDIAYVLPASRYGQGVASHYTQAWLGSTCSTTRRPTTRCSRRRSTTWSRIPPAPGGRSRW